MSGGHPPIFRVSLVSPTLAAQLVRMTKSSIKKEGLLVNVCENMKRTIKPHPVTKIPANT